MNQQMRLRIEVNDHRGDYHIRVTGSYSEETTGKRLVEAVKSLQDLGYMLRPANPRHGETMRMEVFAVEPVQAMQPGARIHSAPAWLEVGWLAIDSPVPSERFPEEPWLEQ